VAQFKVRRVKLQRGMVHRCGVVVCIRWWWGGAFVQREVRSGFGPKTLKPSWCGSVLDCSGAARGGEGSCMVTAPPPMVN